MKNLIDKINADKNFKRETYAYIKNQIDKELSKPFRKRDSNKIEKLNAELCELTDKKVSDNNSNVIESLYVKISEYEKRINKPSVKIFRKCMPALCIFTLIFTANCITVFA